jgi:hypothetical protein
MAHFLPTIILPAVVFYLQSFYNIQMLKTRADYKIILIQTILKNTAAMEHFLGYFESEYWQSF